MQTKAFEVRDRGTFIPVMATKMTPANEAQAYLLKRAGYGDPLIMLCSMNGGSACYDSFKWTGARTLHIAHKYIEEHFDALNDGDVVCVEHILGERDEPKVSERFA